MIINNKILNQKSIELNAKKNRFAFKRYFIVADMYHNIVEFNEMKTTYACLSKKYNCSPRTICNAITVLKNNYNVRSERISNMGKCAGVRLFLNQNASNKIIIDNNVRDEFFKYVNSDECEVLLKNINMKIETTSMFDFSKMLWEKAFKDKNLTNIEEFKRHYYKNPIKLLKALLYGINRMEWGNFYEKSLLITLRTMWKRSKSWFNDNIEKKLKVWYQKAKYHILKQKEKYSTKNFFNVHSNIQTKKLTYQEQKVVEEVEITFNVIWRKVKMIDGKFKLTKALLKVFYEKGRTEPEDFNYFLYALKNCDLNENNEVIELKTLKKFEVYESKNKDLVQYRKTKIAQQINKIDEKARIKAFNELEQLPEMKNVQNDMIKEIERDIATIKATQVARYCRDDFEDIKFYGVCEGNIWLEAKTTKALGIFKVYKKELDRYFSKYFNKPCNLCIGVKKV